MLEMRVSRVGAEIREAAGTLPGGDKKQILRRKTQKVISDNLHFTQQ